MNIVHKICKDHGLTIDSLKELHDDAHDEVNFCELMSRLHKIELSIDEATIIFAFMEDMNQPSE